MSMDLDLDDVAHDHPVAMRELRELRDERDAFRANVKELELQRSELMWKRDEEAIKQIAATRARVYARCAEILRKEKSRWWSMGARHGLTVLDEAIEAIEAEAKEER